MATRDEMASSFGSAAGDYERGRPTYPDAAVAWLLAPAGPHPRVADVGAGTGKLTAALHDVGADVIAVEPDAAMLQTLRSALPGVETLIGRAERMNLPDESLDAMVFGQAWHWVDVAAASAEAGRVLKPGGVLGLVWNIRDESTSWVARLGAIMKGSHAEELLAGEGPAVAAPFATLEHESWQWSRRLTRAELLAMVRSRSYIITAAPAERDRILVEVQELFSASCRRGDDGVEVVDLPYRTEAFRSIRG
ncbi:class I SAM-dependent methyltransferase [Microbacterium sp. VKM Ac-2870]|uniref:class I SAM-dependent methyltransferase n=1 Tax=Microbacterium sp. VKM Ac-2870 TaxID=2783825 RepID=UPI00188CC63A|nr:class I SAM-dependent methyltransferase [Microbacterium sp. VKM Ac-2870]MBF4563284.1 class I SAM-dependent methyltransferase [Microbacterium sp. VKM Ac-2870]